VLALPWWTGQVVEQQSGPLKSAWVSVPASYTTGGQAYRALPRGGKTELLPYSTGNYRVLSWPSGVQPVDCLLGGWDRSRSALCENVGNRYSDFVGTALAAGVAQRNTSVFALARLFGVDSWWIDLDWDSSIDPTGVVSPSDAVAFFRDPNGLAPGRVVSKSVPLSYTLPSLEIGADATSLVGNYAVAYINGIEVQANAALDPNDVFFALRDPKSGYWLPSSAVARNVWHTLTVRVRNLPGQGRVASLAVDGVQVSTLFHTEDGGKGHGPLTVPAAGGGIPLASPTLRVAIEKRGSGVKVVYPIYPALPSSARIADFPKPIFRRSGVYLFSQPALPLIFATRSVACGLPRNTNAWLAAARSVAGQRLPVFLRCSKSSKYAYSRWRRRPIQSHWRELSPATYHVDVAGSSSQPFVVAFLQTCSPGWSLRSLRSTFRVLGHHCIDGFANGWIVEGRGTGQFLLSFGAQVGVDVGLEAGAMLAVACVLVLLCFAVVSRFHMS
jgi:hypothetical protein